MMRIFQKAFFVPTGLFVVCLLVLLRTMVPTIYTLDSAEFVVGAQTLGIVHAPGYPLYTFLLHLFLKIPLGDAGFRGNLFSALCLALAAPVVYLALLDLTRSRAASVCAALALMWAYYVWLIGLFAEVYAPQMLFLSLCLLALARLRHEASSRAAYTAGALFGLSVAINPSTLFFAPGVVVVFRMTRVSWRDSAIAALIGMLIFGASLVYFPVRYAHAGDLSLNLAGEYDAAGLFQPVPLNTLNGIAWMLSGRQFGGLFFESGLVPPLSRWIEFLRFFGGAWLGFGLVVGIVGLIALWRTHRRWFWCWIALFLPYTYFYLAYGAMDWVLMFTPSFVGWALVVALGLKWLQERLPKISGGIVLAALPALLLIINFPRLDLSQEYSVRLRATTALNAAPAESAIFGHWTTIVPLQYMQIVEGQRPDVTIYNLFLFPASALETFVAQLDASEQPVLFVDEAASDALQQGYDLSLMLNTAIAPDEPRLLVYRLRKRP